MNYLMALSTLKPHFHMNGRGHNGFPIRLLLHALRGPELINRRVADDGDDDELRKFSDDYYALYTSPLAWQSRD